MIRHTVCEHFFHSIINIYFFKIQFEQVLIGYLFFVVLFYIFAYALLVFHLLQLWLESSWTHYRLNFD